MNSHTEKTVWPMPERSSIPDRFEVFFQGDLSRYYEYILLDKDDNRWIVKIGYCTPERNGHHHIPIQIEDSDAGTFAAALRSRLQQYRSGLAPNIAPVLDFIRHSGRV